MRGISSAVLSLAAMALSSMTTYLTFFDARYTLTVAVANVTAGIQSGGGRDGEGRQTASYRYWPKATMIFSNRGTRPVVLTDMQLVRSEDLQKCVPEEKAWDTRIDPMIIEPGTVRDLTVEFELQRIDAVAEAGQEFALEGDTSLWCMQWVVFDPNGQRREPMTPFFTLTRGFEAPAAPGERPDATISLDYPQGPETVVSRGLF